MGLATICVARARHKVIIKHNPVGGYGGSLYLYGFKQALDFMKRLIYMAIAVIAACGGACSDHGAADAGSRCSLEELERDTVSAFDHPLAEMPEPTVSLPVKNLGDSYARLFNDSNYVHWAEAEKIGLEPLGDTRSHWQLRRPLVKVVSCEDFYVEPLTYSRPYMIPEGAAMLHEIGRRFRDSLEARGGGDYRIKVTSVLRTPESVAQLRRRNRNAVDSSVHQLGTTVDISYSRFAADSDRIPRSTIDLKNVLAEVLHAMRSEGKCWVKHEHKQPCFHITVRSRGNEEVK